MRKKVDEFRSSFDDSEIGYANKLSRVKLSSRWQYMSLWWMWQQFHSFRIKVWIFISFNNDNRVDFMCYFSLSVLLSKNQPAVFVAAVHFCLIFSHCRGIFCCSCVNWSLRRRCRKWKWRKHTSLHVRLSDKQFYLINLRAHTQAFTLRRRHISIWEVLLFFAQTP